MNTKISRIMWNLKICGRLMQRDLFVLKAMLVRRLINAGVWTAMIIYIYEYVGLATYAGMGLFIACSESVGWGFMGVFGNLVRFMSDLKGQNTFSYHLSLPVPPWMVLAAFCVSQGVQLMVVAAVVLPLAMVILGSNFPFATISFFKVLCIFFCAYLFYGVLTLLYGGLINSVNEIHKIRIRAGDLMFWTGAYFFTWQRLYGANHIFAYFDLLNPLVYACEGMRAAVMGREGSLPFLGCCAALLGYTFVVGIIAVRRMMRKLDCL